MNQRENSQISHEWISSLSPLEFFADFKEEQAALLLSKEGSSRIGIQPKKYLYSLHEVEVFLQTHPEHTIIGYKSYPDHCPDQRIYQAPEELWIVYAEQIQIDPLEDGQFRYQKNTFAREFVEVPQIRSNPKWDFYEEEGYQSSVKKQTYLENVKQIQEQIAAGEYYQANYTLALKKQSTKDPYEVFKDCFAKNPANYFAFLRIGELAIVSTSPELFLYKKDRQLLAQPIKGTLSKKFPLQKLVESQKDIAELNMITDLFRNDLYRVCEAETVKVTASAAVLELEQLYHLCSKIQGTVKEGQSLAQIVSALFPSGSITGCPKIRSQRAIADFEVGARGLYTGNIGWLTKNDFCFNIVIRTLFYWQNTYYYFVGSGIVYDSEPESEWQECLLKAKTFFDCV